VQRLQAEKVTQQNAAGPFCRMHLCSEGREKEAG
jgi:hypothetical protein